MKDTSNNNKEDFSLKISSKYPVRIWLLQTKVSEIQKWSRLKEQRDLETDLLWYRNLLYNNGSVPK